MKKLWQTVSMAQEKLMFSKFGTVAHWECLYFQHLQFLGEESDAQSAKEDPASKSSPVPGCSTGCFPLSREHFATQLTRLSGFECLFSTTIGQIFTGEPQPHKNSSLAKFQNCVQKIVPNSCGSNHLLANILKLLNLLEKSGMLWTHWRSSNKVFRNHRDTVTSFFPSVLQV